MLRCFRSCRERRRDEADHDEEPETVEEAPGAASTLAVGNVDPFLIHVDPTRMPRSTASSSDDDDDDDDAGSQEPLLSKITEASDADYVQLRQQLQDSNAQNTKLRNKMNLLCELRLQLNGARGLLRAILRPYRGDYNAKDFMLGLQSFAQLQVELTTLRTVVQEIVRVKEQNRLLQQELEEARRTIQMSEQEREKHVKEIGALLERNMELQEGSRQQTGGEHPVEGGERTAEDDESLEEDIDNLMQEFFSESQRLFGGQEQETKTDS